MEYEIFKSILNEQIFGKSKQDLIEKIADNPNRYIGLFRPTKPKAKILQNLLQSQEIKFGDAFENLIKKYLEDNQCEILNNIIKIDNGKKLNVDILFQRNKKIYIIEEKIRDDHDSSKKEGQINNFEKKIFNLIKEYGENDLIAIFYFIDPNLSKNKKYYLEELNKISKDYNIQTNLFYGKELFDYLKFSEIWSEIITYLEKWKKDLPDLPEINFDIDFEKTFNEIKHIKPYYYRKLLSNDDIFNDILPCIFPEGKTLNLLLKYFLSEATKNTIYKSLSSILQKRIKL